MPTSERFIENEGSFGFALFQEARKGGVKESLSHGGPTPSPAVSQPEIARMASAEITDSTGSCRRGIKQQFAN